jgi:uncharacterized membrane protein
MCIKRKRDVGPSFSWEYHRRIHDRGNPSPTFRENGNWLRNGWRGNSNTAWTLCMFTAGLGISAWENMCLYFSVVTTNALYSNGGSWLMIKDLWGVMLEMIWHILTVAVVIMLIALCGKLVRKIRRPIEDEDLEYYSKWRWVSLVMPAFPKRSASLNRLDTGWEKSFQMSI